MLSKKQLDKMVEISDILLKLSVCDDTIERGILASTGNLCLQSILSEDVDYILKDVNNFVEDFCKR